MTTTKTKKTAGASKPAAPKPAAKPAPAKNAELDKLTKRVAQLEKQVASLESAPAPADTGLRAELTSLREQFHKFATILHEQSDQRVISKLIGRLFG
mgnify:CR=1 FL=1|tara:strand:- start:5437 stop:5727 length:291 start_codon:yes stop_codon:yes gene_type:complete